MRAFGNLVIWQLGNLKPSAWLAAIFNYKITQSPSYQIFYASYSRRPASVQHSLGELLFDRAESGYFLPGVDA
jgi:hypothetical protein